MTESQVEALRERQARARQLTNYDELLVNVLQPEQHLPGLLEPLGTARQVILDAAEKLWPKQSWESTSSGGLPRKGDLHVKITSVISDDPDRDDGASFVCPAGVALRIGISAIRPVGGHENRVGSTSLGPEADIYVPLDLVAPLMVALQEQLTYWRQNPPEGGAQS